MKYRNARVPEDINVSRHSPLADFAVLSAGVLALFAALGLAALLLGSYAGRYMPVSWENAMAEAMFEDKSDNAAAEGDGEIVAALQGLADRLVPHMDLPDGMAITVHYLDDPGVNAFATLGGHVFVLRGLVERVPHENALAMVLAHEIAHAANRDVAANLGGVLTMQLVLSTITGGSGDLAEQLMNGSNTLLLRRFGREAEVTADADGLAAVAALYGHVGGAESFFEIALEESGRTMPAEGPELLSTHPLTKNRIEALARLAEARGWTRRGPLQALPPVLEQVESAAGLNGHER